MNRKQKRNFSTFMLVLFISLLSLILSSQPGYAAVLFGGSYSQDFNTLAKSPLNSVNPWTDDSTLTGWYMYNNANSGLYVVDDGNGGLINVAYSLGQIGNSDRAFISSRNSGTPNPMIGVKLRNNTGGAINSINVSYTAEQWWTIESTSHTMTFDYSFNAGSLTSGNWINVAGLSATTPQTGTGIKTALDGNNVANQVPLSQTINLTSNWNPGTDIWLRWVSPTGGVSLSSGLGVDDLLVTSAPIPEPATMILLGIGLAGLGSGYRKGRRK